MTWLISISFGFGIWLLLRAGLLLAGSKFKASEGKRLNFANSELSFMVLGACGFGAVGEWLLKSAILVPVLLIGGALIGRNFAAKNLKRHQQTLHLQQKLLLPQFMELVSISLAAGLPIRRAMATAAAKAHQIVSEPWQFVLSDTDTKKTIPNHLDDICRRYSEQPISRVASTFLIATERGTPLELALRGLSAELRSEARRELLELAAKKDVQMMLPVVFGILPSVTVISLYPALQALQILN